MERQFFINWAATVEEAKYRRKSQRLTQSQLAQIARVSTPTLSRFERGEKDIQLSSIMRILTVLGMNDRRLLTFSGKNIYYDFPKELVMFEGEDSQQIIQCAISKMALDDYFNGRGKDPLKAFQAQHEAIEHAARRKYLSGNLEAPNFILLKVSDFEY